MTHVVAVFGDLLMTTVVHIQLASERKSRVDTERHPLQGVEKWPR